MSLQEAEYVEHITINVQIPEDLKYLLVYDYELICRKKKVIRLHICYKFFTKSSYAI